ncbi:MAG: hypothetical protein RLZ25_2210 [Pseudomonadota bacterium]|jgi:hypothetical protein
MQMLFNDLDQAFICTMELRPASLRDYSSADSPELHRVEQDGHDLRARHANANLELLHERLMYMAREERYPEALVIIHKILDLVTQELGISRDATKLNKSHVGHAVMKSMTLFRFHLQLIKTEAFLQSQIGNLEAAKVSLEKVLEFDGSNRLGARELLDSLPKHLNS